MASLKDVKIKTAGVRKTKQITKAMNMVASAKLRGAQQRIETFRPYAAKFYEVLRELAGSSDSVTHPLLVRRPEVKTCAILLCTSDRGLCGGFNANLINAALTLAREKNAQGIAVRFYCVGKKGRDAVRKTGFEIVRAMTDLNAVYSFSTASHIGLDLIFAYESGDVDEVIITYGEFQSMFRQAPVRLPLLPISAGRDEKAGERGAAREYSYEPAAQTLLASLLPQFIKVQIYRALLDTGASEQAARMTAMENATRNCDEMIGTLTLLYNKTRQAAITSDLIDIVGGVEALR